MQPISGVVKSIQSQFQQEIERTSARNLARTQANGWPEDVSCIQCGDTGTVPETNRTCWCRAGREIAARHERSERWRRTIPQRYARYTLAGHPSTRARDRAGQWIAGREWEAEVGANLVILGPVGTGKTGLAIGVLRAAHDAGAGVMYTNVPDILTGMAGLKWEDKDRQMTRYQGVPLMLIDDLGAEHVSDWSASMVYEVVEGRYRNGVPTIITSNLPKRDMREAVGDRIVSRLFEGAAVIDLAGADLRTIVHHGDI